MRSRGIAGMAGRGAAATAGSRACPAGMVPSGELTAPGDNGCQYEAEIGGEQGEPSAARDHSGVVGHHQQDGGESEDDGRGDLRQWRLDGVQARRHADNGQTVEEIAAQQRADANSMPISSWPRTRASSTVTNSGSEVPMATTVAPIT